MFSKLSSLQSNLSQGCEILTNPNDAQFKGLLQRWTNISLQIPAAIVLPTTEEDCQKIVQWAAKTSTPFVIKSGDHSEWSTIGGDGIIVDLDRYSGIEVNVESHTATLKGSVLSKEVAVSLAKTGLFTALGNGNTVGAIPYFLGGGVPVTLSTTGFGSDHIISARVISAAGELLDVSEETHPELLWAIRGAGQFFGLVTQLVIKAHPLSMLGNNRGVIWAGTFVFPIARAAEVSRTMKGLMDNSRYATSGLMIVSAPPPARKPSLVIAARLIGNPNDAPQAFKALYDLKPLVGSGAEVPIQNTSDARQALGAKGNYKRFGIAGLPHFDIDSFLKTITLWQEMIAECPDSINTAFNFQWDSRPPKQPAFESAMCLHDIRYWQNNLVWHTDAKSRTKVDEYNRQSIAVMRGSEKKDWVDYQNATRDGPIEYRYRGEERLARLHKLKKEWDPTGVFTRQLLES